MKRYKMLYLLVILVLSGSLGVGIASAQEDQEELPVVILVVDDFTGGSIFDDMLEISDALDSVLTEEMMQPALDSLLSQLEEVEALTAELSSPATLEEAQNNGQQVNSNLTPILGLGGDTLSGYILSTYPDVANVFAEFGFPIEILDENCAVNYADQGLFSTTPTGLFSTTGTSLFSTTGTGLASGQSHGELVENEILELISTYNASEIEVARVETDNYTTTSITQGLLEEVFSRPADSHFVVNMSFAIVPCGRIADIILYDKLLALAERDTMAGWDVLRDLLTQLFALSDSPPLLLGDPLFDFFNRVCGEGFAQIPLSIDLSVHYGDALDVCEAISQWNGELVSIAAAGNSGAPFPYYPAAWPSVVSVSANESNLDFMVTGTGKKTDYSNTGSVLLPGKWNGNEGTSYAAPRYAFAQALRLLGEGPTFIGCPASSLWYPPVADWLAAPPPPADQDQQFCP